MGEEEARYKVMFVQRFALYLFLMLVVDTIFGVFISDPEYSRIFSIPGNVLASIGIGVSYFLSKKSRLVPATWLLIGSLSSLLGYYSLIMGFHTYIFVAFVLPIAIALAVLSLRITIIMTLVLEAWVVTWGLLQFTAIYVPKPVGSSTLTLINFSICTMLVPLLMLVLYLPARQREQLLKRKNLELTQSLKSLTLRQTQAKTISQEVAGLAELLRASSLQQSGGTSQQFSLISQVNAAVTELVNTAMSIADATKEATRNAESIGEAGRGVLSSAEIVALWSERGTASVKTAVSLNSIAVDKQQKLTQDLAEMLEFLDVMKKASELIKKVATETHVLSINLAIEAAGNNGSASNPRIKSLTASIRELARSTAEANTEISKLLNNLEGAAQTTQNSLTEASTIITQSVEASTEAGVVIQTLHEVSQSSKAEIGVISEQLLNIGALIGQISVATLAQRESCAEVATSLQELSVLAQQNVAASTGVSASSLELASLSSTLIQPLAEMTN